MARGEGLMRQWQLLRILEAHRFGICTDDLARELEYTRRQILRDLAILQQAYFPIRFQVRDNGKKFWYLPPHTLENCGLIFSVTELVSLYLGQQLLSPLAGTQFGIGLSEALNKIRNYLPESTLTYFSQLDNLLQVKNTAVHDYSRHDKSIAILNKAIAENRVLSLVYKSLTRGKAYDTKFHPYGMVFFDNNLYCIGYLAEYEEVRTLKVTRIKSVEFDGETFRRPVEFSLQASLANSFGIISTPEKILIRVRLKDWAATSVRENQWHISQKILADSQDGLDVQFEINDTTEFKRWLLGFGQHAQVMYPKKFRDEVKRELALSVKNYE